jgi:alcohol dehydrogenase class IV
MTSSRDALGEVAMQFEFATTRHIVFGPGVFDRLGEHAAGMGKRALLVIGSRSLGHTGATLKAEKLLKTGGLSVLPCFTSGEPDTDLVDDCTRTALDEECDMVVALGGGATIDLGKAIAALMTNGGKSLDYIEVVGEGKQFTEPSAPFIAIPTTAGTGSEATRNAVLTHRESKTKASLRSRHLLPALALLDPTLTYTLTPATTASTGLDALTQLIEPYTSKRAFPMIEGIALAGMKLAARALPVAFEEPDNAEARSEMMQASLAGGISLAHAGLGAAHAFAAPLGGSYPIPHGFACAALLPHVMEVNLEVARAVGNDVTVGKYARVAEILGVTHGGFDSEVAGQGVKRVRELCQQMEVPRLSSFGVEEAHIPDLVERARKTSSIKANPVELSAEDLARALKQAL